jgi:alpha-amylase/alpha-mannosidase (GH57 family)
VQKEASEIRQIKTVRVEVPWQTITSLIKEFDIKEKEISNFIDNSLQRLIMEHIGEANSNVFSESEAHEIEDDLKGLGYI